MSRRNATIRCESWSLSDKWRRLTCCSDDDCLPHSHLTQCCTIYHLQCGLVAANALPSADWPDHPPRHTAAEPQLSVADRSRQDWRVDNILVGLTAHHIKHVKLWYSNHRPVIILIHLIRIIFLETAGWIHCKQSYFGEKQRALIWALHSQLFYYLFVMNIVRSTVIITQQSM